MPQKKPTKPDCSEVHHLYRELLANIPAKLARYDYNRRTITLLNTDHTWTGHTGENWNAMEESAREELIDPEDRDEVRRRISEWIGADGDTPLLLQYRLNHRDGYTVWIEQLLLDETEADGGVNTRLELSWEVSDRMRLAEELASLKEEIERRVADGNAPLQRVNEKMQRELVELTKRVQALQAGEESFRNLAQDSPDGMMVSTPEGELLFANRRTCDILGYNEDEILELNLSNLTTPDNLKEIRRRLEKRADRHRSLRRTTIRLLTRNGSEVDVELAGVRTTWMNEPADLYIFNDHSERRLSEGRRISIMVRRAVEQKYTFEGLVSKNPSMLHTFELLPTIAASDSSVLILGESGTGKELLAKALHHLSPRREEPLVIVNSGALPDTLIESELFGYMKGAFTDAKQDKPSRFQLAAGGSLFLDEIGDVSPAMQVRLLRALQEKSYTPLGGEEPIKVDVRFICATNHDLDRMVEEGTFRRDLYYRINVVKLTLPPLRERREDIPILAEHFIGQFNRLFGKEITSISPAALSLLMNYDFPGNIRELENFIEHAFLLCRGDKILPDHLPDVVRGPVRTTALPDHSGATTIDYPALASPARATIKDFESQVILESLRRNNWNRTAAAAELGIHRVTLNRKIQRLKLQMPDVDGRSFRRSR